MAERKGDARVVFHRKFDVKEWHGIHSGAATITTGEFQAEISCPLSNKMWECERCLDSIACRQMATPMRPSWAVAGALQGFDTHRAVYSRIRS